jgi:hypothetical protein
MISSLEFGYASRQPIDRFRLFVGESIEPDALVSFTFYQIGTSHRGGGLLRK